MQIFSVLTLHGAFLTPPRCRVTPMVSILKQEALAQLESQKDSPKASCCCSATGRLHHALLLPLFD